MDVRVWGTSFSVTGHHPETGTTLMGWSHVTEPPCGGGPNQPEQRFVTGPPPLAAEQAEHHGRPNYKVEPGGFGAGDDGGRTADPGGEPADRSGEQRGGDPGAPED